VSTPLLHSLFVLVPLGLAAVLALLIYRTKGPHPASYKMSEPWRHAPILWASEEPAAHGHAGHDDHLTIGGGASGKW
jgi:hypothetical protein